MSTTGAYRASGQGTMVAKTVRSSAWLTTAADIIEAVKCSELTPYKLKNTFFNRSIHMGAKTQDIFFNLDSGVVSWLNGGAVFGWLRRFVYAHIL